MLDELDPELELGEEGDEGDKTIYCFCQRVSFGEMIGCDGSECEREWVSRRFALSLISALSSPLAPRFSYVLNFSLTLLLLSYSSTSAVLVSRLFPRVAGSAMTAE